MTNKASTGRRNSRRSGTQARPDLRAGAPDDKLFHAGAVVLATLRHPSEKFCGVFLAPHPAGVSLKGVELPCSEDRIRAAIAKEQLKTGVLFFPIERVDGSAGNVPESNLSCMGNRFRLRTRVNPRDALARAAVRARRAGA